MRRVGYAGASAVGVSPGPLSPVTTLSFSGGQQRTVTRHPMSTAHRTALEWGGLTARASRFTVLSQFNGEAGSTRLSHGIAGGTSNDLTIQPLSMDRDNDIFSGVPSGPGARFRACGRAWPHARPFFLASTTNVHAYFGSLDLRAAITLF